MATKVEVDESWASLDEVRRLCKKERDSRLRERLIAIRMLMQGRSRREVAASLDVSPTTIYYWKKAWNESGLAGLRPSYRGSRSKVTQEMEAEIEDIVEVKQVVDGKTVTGYLIQGYLKKNSS